MKITFEGRTIPIQRVETGFYTFDQAFANAKGDIGFPVKPIVEIFGPTHSGKSTLSYTLAALIAQEYKRGICLVDFEGFDPDYVGTIMDFAGYEGKVYNVTKERDEDDLEELENLLRKKCVVGIIDSLGAISPIGELEGKLYDANMGRRAALLARHSRRLMHIQRMHKYPITVIATNHVHARLGGFGVVTPGGETKNYLAAVQIRIKEKERFPDGSYYIEGFVKKNKWGIKGKKFWMFCLVGKGFHKGLTAVIECLELKYAKKRKGTGVILLEDEETSRLSTFVRSATSNQKQFSPFVERLRQDEKDKNESEG